VCKVTFVKILEVQGHRPDFLSLFRIELANTLVGNAKKKKRKCNKR